MAKIYRIFRIFIIWPKRSQKKKMKITELYVLLKINNNHGRHILLTHLAEIEASNIKNLANYNLI